MDPNCLEYRLTAQEREHFERQGYLVVPGALDHDRVRRLVDVVDGRYREELRRGLSPHLPFVLSNFLPVSDEFVELIDHPRIFPKVWAILGHNIYLYHAHLGVTPPLAGNPPPVNEQLRFHQDSGRVNFDVESEPRPRLSLKVAYFLEGDPAPGNANMYLIPGSHLSNRPPSLASGGASMDQAPAELQRFPGSTTGEVPGAVPISVAPGTAVLFDRRIWHSKSPNFGQSTRKALFYGYAYRWLRTKDEMTVRHLYPRLDPIRRQILGDGLSADGYYSPTPADVPLRAWIEQHDPASLRL
jgi:ectoine hydroxylase-related dioxygenase (phytanoyl-CoA dioxygenase family)